MKAIILAAGYATRLYPLTQDKPKPLLEVAGKTILQHILEKIAPIESIDWVLVVANAKFAGHFTEWVNHYSYLKPVQVINDQTTTNEGRLGAIADMQYVIDQVGIADDCLVLAGDNLFDFALTDFVAFYRQKQADLITAHAIHDCQKLRRTGVVTLDATDRVTSFQEKPEQPASNLAVPPFYIYQKETLPLIADYLKAGNPPDAPGNFIPWLITKKPVYAYRFVGERYDIGTIESYREVCAKYRSKSS